MDISTYKILTFFTFLLLSGLFSSTETAFTAVNRIRLKGLFEKEKPKQTEDVERLLEHPSKLITAILIGNNLCNVACSALGTTIIIDIFRQFNVTNLAIIMPTVTIFLTILLLIFGEITPKTLALKQPERFAVFSSKFISPFFILFYPVIIVFEAFNVLINKLIKSDSQLSNRSLNIDELKLMLDISHDDGVIESEKNKMLNSIFEFSDTVVREVMTPRTDAICISDKESTQRAIEIIMNVGHSRIPVYEEKMDNIVGIIYAKDLLNVPSDNGAINVKKFMRDAEFIPETKPVEDLLTQMKRSKFHMAIVVDEYGGMSGIVTLEDIVEEILGEIQDEYDQDQKNECIKIQENKYDVDAKINIKDLEHFIGVEFPDDEDFDTLGGLILSINGSIPQKNEVFNYKNLSILVKEVKKRRILRLEITKKQTEFLS
ncbi:MAG: HlyC/CorC family transporter [Candidatus Margulisbacteria bacterium]|nr:HlyC/CorC family transporter [Candidatus Margulisiibacteriota bacterium]